MTDTDRLRPCCLIGICTRNRADLLGRLIESLNRQEPTDLPEIAIAIIDNNDVASSEVATVAAASLHRVHIIHEPRAGLVNARNALLTFAEKLDADWLIGVDDDVWMDPDWLAHWAQAILSSTSDVYVGGSSILFDRTQSRLLQPVIKLNETDDEEYPSLSTVNFAISAKVFHTQRGHGLRFDPAFNFSGGEDAEFMMRAKRQFGLTPVSHSGAEVREERIGPRASLRYELSRNLRDQVNGYRISKAHRARGIFEPQHSLIVMVLLRTNHALVTGTGRLLLGLLTLPVSVDRGLQTIGTGISCFARAVAFLPFFFGRASREYAPKAV